MKPAKPSTLAVVLTPAPKAKERVSLLQQAQGISIVDKSSHVACREHLKGAKALKREVVDHFKRIKDPINVARNTVLDMERETLAPIDEAIRLLERADTDYVREQTRIEQAEADERRRVAEAEEQRKRDEDAATAEAAALKLEASSNVLSEREQIVVGALVKAMLRGGIIIPDSWLDAVKLAKYADPKARAAQLMDSAKINAAIDGQFKAAIIRRQAEAAKAAPILVDVAPVESQIGVVPGTGITTTWACESFEVKALLRRLADGYGTDANVTSAVDSYLLKSTKSEESPMLRLLHAEARKWKTLFEQIWPMARLSKTHGVRG